MSYTGAAERPQSTVGHADMIAYFANHQPEVLGRLDRCYGQWANLKVADCRECIQLADLFSRGVDSVKSGERAIPCDQLAYEWCHASCSVPQQMHRVQERAMSA